VLDDDRKAIEQMDVRVGTEQPAGLPRVRV
jgi:hypothetical protein